MDAFISSLKGCILAIIIWWYHVCTIVIIFLTSIFSLFTLLTQTTAPVVKTALSAVQQPDAVKTISTVAAGFMPAILSSSAAMATEGTNEWFGVDDLRLLAVLFAGHYFILSLWLGQYGNATEDDDADFFGEIDYTGR
eukprot:scaffold26592_cov171-Skeletonema_menzelii.AAC.6